VPQPSTIPRATPIITIIHLKMQVKEGEMGRARSTHGERRNAFMILVGTSEGKRPLGRHRRRWEDNIKMDPRMAWYGLDSSSSG
jgi:hypothetical protein